MRIMVDDIDSAKRNPKLKNERLLVQRAIPKIASALHSIVTKTKDKDFQERCKHKTEVRDLEELPKKVEDKLWEIACYRLGTSLSLNQDENNDQVVPQNHGHQIIGKKLKEQASKKQECTVSCLHEIHACSDLSSLDIDYCDKPDGGFYKQEQQRNEKLNKAYDILNTCDTPRLTQTEHCPIYSLQDTRQKEAYCDEDDWLSQFTQDCYWLNKTLKADTAHVKSFPAKMDLVQQIDTNGSTLTIETQNGLSCVNTYPAENDREDALTDKKSEAVCTSPANMKETFYVNGNNYSSPKGSPVKKNLNNDIQEETTHAATKRMITKNHEYCSMIKQIPNECELSLQDRNTLMDDFDALEDLFDD